MISALSFTAPFTNQTRVKSNENKALSFGNSSRNDLPLPLDKLRRLNTSWKELSETPFVDLADKIQNDRSNSLEPAARYVLQAMGIEPGKDKNALLQQIGTDINTREWNETLSIINGFDVTPETVKELKIPENQTQAIKEFKRQSTILPGIRIPQNSSGDNLKIVPVRQNSLIPGRSINVEHYETKVFPFLSINQKHAERQGVKTAGELKDILNELYGKHFSDGEIPGEFPITEIRFAYEEKNE